MIIIKNTTKDVDTSNASSAADKSEHSAANTAAAIRYFSYKCEDNTDNLLLWLNFFYVCKYYDDL